MKARFHIASLFITTLITLCLSAQPEYVSAQIDTIRLKDKRLNTAALKPGLRQYLVIFQMPKRPKNLNFSYWIRDTRLQTRNGEKLFATTQHWYGSDTTGYRSVYSINRASDFAPIYHSETVNNKNGSYNWGAGKIIGADTVAQNLKKDFSLDFAQPCFNWNLDMETFEMLPLAAGKTFAINFYDAGFGKPEYILYKVSGSEVLTTLDNQKVDCWKLLNESDHNGMHATQTFWISKKGHEFLKEEDMFGGSYRYKIKLPAGTPDVLQRFAQK